MEPLTLCDIHPIGVLFGHLIPFHQSKGGIRPGRKAARVQPHHSIRRIIFVRCASGLIKRSKWTAYIS